MKIYEIPEIVMCAFNTDDIMVSSGESVLSWTQQGSGDALGFGDLMRSGL